MKNQDGGLKVPLFHLKPGKRHVRCQNLIGSYASTQIPSILFAPATEIRTHKVTKINILKPLTYELFLQNSPTIDRKDVYFTIPIHPDH